MNSCEDNFSRLVPWSSSWRGLTELFLSFSSLPIKVASINHNATVDLLPVLIKLSSTIVVFEDRPHFFSLLVFHCAGISPVILPWNFFTILCWISVLYFLSVVEIPFFFYFLFFYFVVCRKDQTCISCGPKPAVTVYWSRPEVYPWYRAVTIGQ